MKSKALILSLITAASALFAYATLRSDRAAVRYATATVEKGDVVEVVGATGTLQAVTTVQVGSQVSGTIARLHADFNDRVTQGQVVARLDPSLFEARLQQARANLTATRANVDRARAALTDAEQKRIRAQELSAQQLLPESELETARANADSAIAQLKANQAAVSQAEASVNQAEVDLTHTVIRAPIDGVVIARNVDVGQTVAASLQAPVLFVIANDLKRMQVRAGIDEADVGRVSEGQEASFRVDAFPEDSFPAKVLQVRLQPQVVSNVVTYDTLLAVENEDLRLKPGMTATVSVEVRRANDVLRVPASALRFRPEAATGAGGDGSRTRPAGMNQGRGEGGVSARSLNGGASGRAQGRAEGRREGRAEGNGSERGGPGGPAGLVARGREATLYLQGPDQKPVPTPVVLGLSDGQFVEVRSGLEEGATVITGVAPASSSPSGQGPRPGASPSTNPFSPTFQRRQR